MTSNLPNRLTSLLDAVNTCLFAIGLAPVNSIVNNEDLDVANALSAIRAQDLEVQSLGWSWNLTRQVRFLPNSAGHIQLPDNLLFVDKAYREREFVSSFSGTPCDVTERGDRLFDKENNTFVFEEGIVLDYITRFPYEELPEVAKRYIAIKAAQILQSSFEGYDSARIVTQEQVSSALVALERHEDRVRDRDLVTGNLTVLGGLYGRGIRRKQNY